MFKVTMTNLGRNKATETATFPINPEFDDLYSMAKKHLYSDGIDFMVKHGDPEEGDYPVSGIVTAGVHDVGKFKIEDLEAQS